MRDGQAGRPGRDGQPGQQGSPGVPAPPPTPSGQTPTRLPLRSPVANLVYQGVYSLSGENSATFVSTNNGASFQPSSIRDSFDIRQDNGGEVEAIRKSEVITVTPRTNGTIVMSPADIAGDDILTVITDYNRPRPRTDARSASYTNYIVWWPDINGINKDSNAQVVAQYTVLITDPPPAITEDPVDPPMPIQRYAEVIRPVERLDFYNVTGEASIYPPRNELVFEAQALISGQPGNEIIARKSIGITPVRTDGSFRFTGTDSEFTVSGPSTSGNIKTTTVRWYPRISGHAAYNLESVAELRFIDISVRYRSIVDPNPVPPPNSDEPVIIFRDGGTERRRDPGKSPRRATFQVHELQHGGTRWIRRLQRTLTITPNFTDGRITTSGATVTRTTLNNYPHFDHTLTFSETVAGQQFTGFVVVRVVLDTPTPRNLQATEVLT